MQRDTKSLNKNFN